MNRTVTRTSKLPAYKINLDDLEMLIYKLSNLFDSSKKVFVRIEIIFDKERLVFDSVEEMKNYKIHLNSVKKYYIKLSQINGKSIDINHAGFISYFPSIDVYSDEEGWCAGAIETARTFLKHKATSYNWFVNIPIGSICILIIILPYIFKYNGYNIMKNNFILSSWLFTITILTIFKLYKREIFVPSSIVISSKDNFIRRNAPELAIIISIISALLTIIGWFF